MDIDVSETIKTVNTLVGQNQDLQRQVETLAKQNMKQARAMRSAHKAMWQVIESKEDDGAIYDENGRIETVLRHSLNKLAMATTGTL